MPAPFTDETWTRRISRVLQLPDLAELFALSGLTKDQIPPLLGTSEQEILSATAEETKLAEDLSHAVSEAQKRLGQYKPAPNVWGSIALSLGSVIFMGTIVEGLVVTFRNGWRALFHAPYSYWGIGGFVAFMSLGVLYGWLEERRKLKSERQLAEERRQLNIDSLQVELERAKERYENAVLEKGLTPQLRGALHSLVTPSYASTLGAYTDRGLSEVFDSANEINTYAKKKLEQLLTLPGGSIGVAGPRGAGKSTLLMSVANQPAPAGKKPFCSVLCSAPVEYAARDFILNLFSIVCLKVLKKDYEEVEPKKNAPQTSPPPWRSFLPWLISYGPQFGAIVGLPLLLVGLLLGIVLMPPPAPSQQQLQPLAHAAPVSGSQSNSQATQPESFRTRYLKGLDVKPGPLVLWGTCLISMSLALTLFRPWFWRLEREREIRKKWESEREREPSYASIENAAYQHLRNLRFLQSFSTGWSSSLKLPLLEGGVNSVETLAGNQQTLPEIVERFRRFLLRITTTEFSQVLICIDELDKLESDEKAYAFLNEIKAIFGIKNVFYLVSVSENAISKFERRGLPFRDVFDSSFDAILHVDYLDLAGSKLLLKRRTTKLPEPFLCFCHCLSGGLPRDLIRACRDMLQTSRQTNVESLSELSKLVLTNDIKAKVQATRTALSKLDLEPDRTIFLGKLADLSRDTVDPKRLLNWCSNIVKELRSATKKKHARPRRTNSTGIVPYSADIEKLASLRREFAMYLYYIAVMEQLFFCRKFSDSEWRGLETSGIWDQLASTRQSLAVNPIVGGVQLSQFCQRHRLDGLDVSFPEPN